MLKRKRIISFVMVIIFVLELPFITYKKAEVNATVAIPVIVGAGQALAGVLGTALACLGIVGIGKSALDATDKKLEEMSEAEQEEYYNNTYTNTQSAIKKLYQDGYLSDMKTLDEAVGHMLANDDEACTVSLKMFLDENDLTKDDLKVYNSGKKTKMETTNLLLLFRISC